jgi:hypothetical protein
VNPQRAEDSLILWKGGGRLPHQGGKRFHAADPGDRGLPNLASVDRGGRAVDQAESPELVTLEVLPGSQRPRRRDILGNNLPPWASSATVPCTMSRR